MRNTFKCCKIFIYSCLLFYSVYYAFSESPPKKIISLSPTITEILFFIDAGDIIVGVTQYCNYPNAAKDIDKVGGYFAKTINIEALVSLAPDLIICEKKAHGSLRSTFEQLSIPALYIDITDIDSIIPNINIIADAVGKKDSALNKVQSLQIQKAHIAGLLSDVEGYKVFWEIWDDPLMTTGPDTYIGQSIDMLKCKNIFSDASTNWPQVSPESVILRDPEVIIVTNTRNGIINAKKIAERKGWQSISAVKNNRIFILDEDLFSRPGPRLFNALISLINVIYPLTITG